MTLKKNTSQVSLTDRFLYYNQIMQKIKTKGYLNAIFAAISYGTNPLFALPMYKLGMGVNSVLFYRYLFAVIIYGMWLKFIKKISFKITRKEFLSLFVISILFALSSILLFSSFKYLDSGIACTILFIYPFMVAGISRVFFNEKISKTGILSMIITVSGIFILNGGINGNLNLKGVIFVILSSFSYAIYIVLVKNLKAIKHIKYDKLSFYIMFFGLSVFIINLKLCLHLQPINDWRIFGCAIALAMFPTIISLETINIAIRIIGSTPTAIVGALEPLTALVLGYLFFGEILTIKSIIGIILILSGVILIISRK